jgi:hypothetical protein
MHCIATAMMITNLSSIASDIGYRPALAKKRLNFNHSPLIVTLPDTALSLKLE